MRSFLKSHSKILSCVLLAGASSLASAATFSVTPSADAFLRASDTTHNYGGGGMLSVSGSAAMNAANTANGAFDTLMKFPASSIVTSLNSQYGAGLWTMTGIALKLTEVATPGNAVFNVGAGSFQVRWVSNDNWNEGTGTPMAPQIIAGSSPVAVGYSDEATLLNAGTDQNVGTFSSLAADGLRTINLTMPPQFLADVAAGNDVTLFITATGTTGAFNFRSHEFGTAAQRPTLEFTAVPEPSGLAVMALGMLFVRRRCALGKIVH